MKHESTNPFTDHVVTTVTSQLSLISQTSEASRSKVEGQSILLKMLHVLFIIV